MFFSLSPVTTMKPGQSKERTEEVKEKKKEEGERVKEEGERLESKKGEREG